MSDDELRDILDGADADLLALQRVYERIMEAVRTALGPLQPGDEVEIVDAVEQWFGGGQ